MNTYELHTPLTDTIRSLHVGDVVYISGIIYTSRDMAHLKFQKLLEEGKPLPKNFNGSVIFHAGPVCLKNSDGSWRLNMIGPTTSIRMEPYAEMVGQIGVRALIGKGGMGEDTLEACRKYGYVYLQAAPGCAAQLSLGVCAVKDVTYYENGMPEALWTLEVHRFGPLVVGMDTHGNSIYHELKCNALKKLEENYPVA